MYFSGYDAALYSAATSYYQQQQAAKVKVGVKTKTKMPPKQPQLHYCDVCKISCAGPQVNKKSPTMLRRINGVLSSKYT